MWVVDNEIGAANYSEIGVGWLLGKDSAAVGGDYRFVHSLGALPQATWLLPALAADDYELLATWPSARFNTNNLVSGFNNVEIKVDKGSVNLLDEYTDQRSIDPWWTSATERPWKSIGNFTLTAAAADG